MPTFIVSIKEIEEPSTERDSSAIEHYRRRVETPDIAHTIRSLDAALNHPVRKPRKDRGTKRGDKTQGEIV